MLLLTSRTAAAAARAATHPAAAAKKNAAAAAIAASVTTQASKGEGAGTNVKLGSASATAAGTGHAAQEDWMTRAQQQGERAEKAAERTMKDAPEFSLHRAGLGFDLSALADAIRSSWGGRAPQAAEAVAKMVADPGLARRLPFPPPVQRAKKAKADEEGEGEDEGASLPLRWRRLTPDAGKDEWYEIPTKE
jgi:hypothetical protein